MRPNQSVDHALEAIILAPTKTRPLFIQVQLPPQPQIRRRNSRLRHPLYLTRVLVQSQQTTVWITQIHLDAWPCRLGILGAIEMHRAVVRHSLSQKGIHLSLVT